MEEITVPAKLILFGEHAVVYGEPAIAVPMTAYKARITWDFKDAGYGLRISAPYLSNDLMVVLDDELSPHALVRAAQLALRVAGVTQAPDLHLHLRSNIPLGRNLGSGASVATAIIKGLLTALQVDASLETINEQVYEIEKLHHGTPSGIDNTVVVYEKPVYFVKGQPPKNFVVNKTFSLLVADSGYGTPTHVPVGDVRKLYEKEPNRVQGIVERIGEITNLARDAMQAGNTYILGDLMSENHDLLQRLTVSSMELDLLCEAAIHAGARGAKMSGGGRGGNMIALVDNAHLAKVMNALQRAGATRIVKTRVLAQ